MQTLDIKNDGAIRTITLNRPDALNALNAQMTDDLTDAFLQASEASSVKVVVLTGAGKAFWAGADLKEMGNPNLNPKHTFADMLDAILDCPKPFIIAVNGVGVGIGATICGLADMVVISEDAKLRCPFSSLGLTAEAASTYTFPRLMGHQKASWFLLSGEWMNAQQCVETGLAMEKISPNNLLEHTYTLAQSLADLPTSSLQTTKNLLRYTDKTSIKAAIKQENKGLADLAGSAANKEALAAFRDKRPPNFSNL